MTNCPTTTVSIQDINKATSDLNTLLRILHDIIYEPSNGGTTGDGRVLLPKENSTDPDVFREVVARTLERIGTNAPTTSSLPAVVKDGALLFSEIDTNTNAKQWLHKTITELNLLTTDNFDALVSSKQLLTQISNSYYTKNEVDSKIPSSSPVPSYIVAKNLNQIILNTKVSITIPTNCYIAYNSGQGSQNVSLIPNNIYPFDPLPDTGYPLVYLVLCFMLVGTKKSGRFPNERIEHGYKVFSYRIMSKTYPATKNTLIDSEAMEILIDFYSSVKEQGDFKNKIDSVINGFKISGSYTDVKPLLIFSYAEKNSTNVKTFKHNHKDLTTIIK
ncbi:hypothetical protein AB832_06630 [Flavobacteriaceae bacterium (ex Bugula neritina AB1)]|nr:hypothetical protein AB832_06630 [Flavobacteriaceae bacterium (ex Bugula neritina AB1)]